MLSEAPDHVLRLSRLAQPASASLSRLSNVVRRLEGCGLLRKEPDPDDGRATCAVLTDAGLPAVEQVSPGHAAPAREMVIDALKPMQLAQLGTSLGQILTHLAPVSVTRPEWFDS